MYFFIIKIAMITDLRMTRVTLCLQRDKLGHMHIDIHIDTWVKTHTYRSIKHLHTLVH